MTESEKVKEFVINLIHDNQESKLIFNEFIKNEHFYKEYDRAIKLYNKELITKEESYRLMTREKYKEGEKEAMKKYYTLLKDDPVGLYKNLLTNIYFDTYSI